MVLIIRLIEINNDEIEKTIEEAMDLIKNVGINIDDLLIYITDDHNKVRENLGLKPLETKEWPIKYLGDEGGHIISIIPSELIKINDDERRLMILREAATIKALNDPLYLSHWVYRDEKHQDPLIHRVSLALLRRTIDLIIAEVGLSNYLIKGFERNDLRNTLSGCVPTRDCAITALALDTPLSIELAGDVGLSRSLWNEITRGLSSDFLRKYDDFRDFIRNNFNVENAYNYLTLLFK